MLQHLRRLEFTPHTVNMQTMLAALIIYLLVVFMCLWSVFDETGAPRRRGVRWFWAFLIVAVPVVGMLAYLPYSVRGQAGQLLGLWRKPR